MLTQEDVRFFISDYPEVNRLLGEEEFSDEYIHKCQQFAIANYNDMAPFTQYQIEEFPFFTVLLHGTLYYMLRGAGLKRARNKLAYNAGDATVDDEAVSDLYLSLSDNFRGLFENKARETKIAENMKKGWSNVRSPYRGR
jgi:hypothetical protein